MYLSRLELDLKKRDTMRAMASPALFHGAVESAFPSQRCGGAESVSSSQRCGGAESAASSRRHGSAETVRGENAQMSLFSDADGVSADPSPLSLFDAQSDGARERKLWRIDTLRGKTYLLLLSRTRPDLSRAAGQFGAGTAWETKDYTPLLDSIREGERLRFRLTANPTVSRSRPRDAAGDKPRGTVYAHITTEFQRRWLTQRAERNGFRLEENAFDVVECRWRSFKKHGGRRVTLLSATYEGVLEVTDAEAFRGALVSGIGRGRAYGMGLLTVMRTGVRHG